MAKREDQIKAWREHIPNKFDGSYRKQYDKAMKRQSMRAAVNSKCLDCMNWQQPEVRDCDIVTCPLHSYRPYTSNLAHLDSPKSVDEKINHEIQDLL